MDILVVDDEPAVQRTLRRSLSHHGFGVHVAHDGRAALELMSRFTVDAVVLDVVMPGVDGLRVCRTLRARGNRVPILLLTARDGVGARVEGLDAGADDYLVKPFALAELLARLRAVLRRAEATQIGPPRLSAHGIALEPRSRVATVAGEVVELTSTESALLEVFVRHPGRVLTRRQLYEAVWGTDLHATSNSLDVYIGYLRRKIEARGHPRLLHTVRGVGFVLDAREGA